MNAGKYIADFDSATAMMRAVSRYLQGKDFPQIGQPSPLLRPLVLINLLPSVAREKIYVMGGWMETFERERIGEVNAEDTAGWVTSHYPAPRYPGVMLGSSNGAAAHLCAALGVPFLPQTILLPVRHHGVHPDEPRYALEAFRKAGETLLKNNPELQLHHMHDANQDSLMIQTMGYFRLKRRRLGSTWERFLKERVAPGGTVYLLECEKSWPVRTVSERYVFQHGAVGGLSAEEAHDGKAEIADFLGRRGSHRTSWDPPEPDAEGPEAEWGFEPALREDVERVAREADLRVKRIVFNEPRDLSPLVADFHRWWHRQRGIETNRLVAESFICIEPWWMLRTGSVPFWLVFNKRPSLEALAEYLDGAEPFDEIYTTLFSHGVDSVGLASIDEWKDVLKKARQKWGFLGLDEKKFPRDFATFVRYHLAFKKLRGRYPMPDAISFEVLERFLKENGRRYPVKWIESVGARRSGFFANAIRRSA